MPLCTMVGPGNIVSDADPAPPQGAHPQISVHVFCGQMAAWIKMPLGMKVGIGPAALCYMGTQLPPLKRGTAPQFLVHVYCGQITAPNFWPMSIVAKFAFSALSLLVGQQEGHPTCKKMGDVGGGHWLVRMESRPGG